MGYGEELTIKETDYSITLLAPNAEAHSLTVVKTSVIFYLRIPLLERHSETKQRYEVYKRCNYLGI